MSPTAITGTGIITAIGNNHEEVTQAIRHATTGIGTMRYLHSTHKELPVGEVKMSDQQLADAIHADRQRHTSRTVLMGAYAILQALGDAHLTADTLRTKRVALISGTTVGGMDVTERLFQQLKTDDTLLPYLRQHDAGSATQLMAELSGIPAAQCVTISTACSSALNAIMVACDMLRAGEADIAIAGGTEALSLFHLNGFNTLMILDHNQCRPFDRRRAGLNLGEGAAYLVLQRADAVAKETIKAYVRGYGNRCDAYHQTASSPDGQGAYLAMQEALRTAHLQPDDIDYINAHGTGTPNNDPSESAAIHRLFRGHLPAISSTKGLTGHTTSASGSIETVISLLAMQHNVVPGSYGFEQQDEACITPIARAEQRTIDNVMCNAFGFGGNDSSLIISRHPGDDDDHVEPCDVTPVTLADVTIDTVEQLADSRQYISPKEARRMGRLMKAATMTALKALHESGTTAPDAIITATAYGMLATSEQFLDDMTTGGEQLLKPTLFMQSTHNTVGSDIAIRTKCHGYNITFTQGPQSMDIALHHARHLVATGQARRVLVECHDEATPLFRSFHERANIPAPREIYSRSVVIGGDVSERRNNTQRT